ncbi:hypothetical protein AKO1_006609 [Acrasis kona]|uniref:Utp18 n=1 Tax=Acrasis kona TaxID=1008807 RepID=A0AAW2ZNJ3_9EUKA
MGINQDKMSSVEPTFMSFDASGRFRFFHEKQRLDRRLSITQEDHIRPFSCIIQLRDTIFLSFNRYRAYLVDISAQSVQLMTTFWSRMDSVTKLSETHVLFRSKSGIMESFHLWDTVTLKQVDSRNFEIDDEAMNICIHPLNNRQLIVVDGWKIAIYDYIRGEYDKALPLKKHRKYRGSIMLKNGKIAVYSSDTVYIWDIDKRKCEVVLRRKKHTNTRWIKVVENGQYILCFEEERVDVFCNFYHVRDIQFQSKIADIHIVNDYTIGCVTEFEVFVIDLTLYLITRSWTAHQGEIIVSAYLPSQSIAIVLKRSDRQFSFRRGDLLVFDLTGEHFKPRRVRRNAEVGWVFDLRSSK